MKQVEVVHKPELRCGSDCDHGTVEAFMLCTRIKVSMVSGTIETYNPHVDEIKRACREVS